MARDTTTNPGLWAAALATAVSILVGSSAAAIAAPLPRLAVDRAPDAADCPDAQDLAAAVEQHMQRPALDAAGTEDAAGADLSAAVYQVRIFRSEDGYSATLQAGDLTRQFSDAGSRCDELAGAVALTLAILLDSAPAARPKPSAAVRSKPARRAAASPAPASPAPLRRSVLGDVGIDAGAAATLGFLAPLSVAFTSELSFRFPSVSLGVGALVIPPRTVEVAPGTVEVWLAAGAIRLCADVAGDADRAHLALCGQGLIGGIHGTGTGYAPDRKGSAPWLALGPAGLAEGPIAGPVGWSLRATCTFPILASAFTVEQPSGAGSAPRTVTAFSPWPVNILVGAGLRVAIR